jgi:hypothetical protein
MILISWKFFVLVVIYIGTKGPSFRSKRLEPLLPSFLTLRCHVLDAQMPA